MNSFCSLRKFDAYGCIYKMKKFIYLDFVLLSLVGTSVNPSRVQQKQPAFSEDTLQPTYGDVIFSNIVHRHGDRNPISSYPTDPYKEYFIKAGIGQLVKAGKQRAYRLGVWARARYAKLVETKPYHVDYIKVLSSDVDRVIQSGLLFLAGFYPPKFDQEVWNDHILWQPIAVRQIPSCHDNLIQLTASCSRYNFEIEVHLKEFPEIKYFYKRYGTKFFNYIEKYTGMKIPRNDAILAINQLYELYDTLLVQAQLGLKHSDWVKTVYPEPLLSIEKIYFRILVFNGITKRLKGGPLIEHMNRAMLKKRCNDTDEISRQVFQVYSGHDNTIATLLHTLGVYDDVPPPYSSAVFIELRYKEGNYFVTILYRESEEKPPILLELPNCKNPCTLDAFIQSTSSLVPSNWKQECQSFPTDYNEILF